MSPVKSCQYEPFNFELACRKSAKRKKEKRKRICFTPEVQGFVEELLWLNYSPEQIVGIEAKKGVACVSHERIYQHIWKDKQAKGLLNTHLSSRGKRYKKRGLDYGKRGQLIGRVDISMRPAVVEQRVR